MRPSKFIMSTKQVSFGKLHRRNMHPTLLIILNKENSISCTEHPLPTPVRQLGSPVYCETCWLVCGASRALKDTHPKEMLATEFILYSYLMPHYYSGKKSDFHDIIKTTLLSRFVFKVLILSHFLHTLATTYQTPVRLREAKQRFPH